MAPRSQKQLFPRPLRFFGKKLLHLISPPPVVAAVRLSGVIGHVSRFQSGLSADGMSDILKRAFAQPKLKAVALLINSPGGSPAQSALISQRIRLLADEKRVPVYAFVEDVAASGGYWLACAADEIYAQESSIVGSIGVISASFGFQGLIDRLGIERRVHSEGAHKSVLDPFLAERKEDIAILKHIQKDIHRQFKAEVKRRRGKRLKGSEATLFSGLFWTGSDAQKLGLIDGIAEVRSFCREKFGKRAEIRVIRPGKPFLKQMLGARGAPAGAFTEGLLESLEIRSYWQRFGL
jgi:signal peptide peptidase SppA